MILTGKIHLIKPAVTMNTKSGNVFTKRTLVIDNSHTSKEGTVFESYVAIAFVQDKCSLLDAFQPGQFVNVTFDLQGRYYQPKDEYYNDLRGWKIELANPAAQTSSQPAPPVGYQQPVPQAPQYAQPAAPAPMPAQNVGNNEPGDELPF